ncbi:MAG: hypothetical protein WC657_02625 [Candidatus Paceibacterota bacterium]|jgi:hypothetical protein
MEGIKFEKNRDPFLEELWSEYGFRGKPPFADSVAEKRLKESCNSYANFVDRNKNQLPGEEKLIYGVNKIGSSEVGRRALHNQIALMVMGEQRSGMDIGLAKKIGEFAYEYSRGYKTTEAEKYGK